MTFEPKTAQKSVELLSERPMRMIAVDIGNTAWKFGLFDVPRLDASAQNGTSVLYPFSMVDIRLLPKQLKALPIWVSTFAHDTDESPEPFFWFIASVNHSRTEALLDLLNARRTGNDIVGFLNNSDVPLDTAYADPTRLGVDRKLAALAASRRFTEKTPVLLVDIGTAAKIDLVSQDGVFLGGAILPGLQTNLDSLSENTDALPSLAWSPNKTSWDYPAAETSDALLLGAAGSLIGAILCFYEESLQKTGQKSIPIILTGGGAAGIEPHLFKRLTRFFPEDKFGPLWIRTVRDIVLTGIELTREEIQKRLSAVKEF